MMRLMFIEDLLCSRHSAKLSMGMISFDLYKRPMSRYCIMVYLTDGETELQFYCFASQATWLVIDGVK